MFITSKTEYGLRALQEIAVNGDHPVTRVQIANNRYIPLPYLTQVLRELVSGGILVSTRGPLGGYVLARAPQEITLLEVVNLLQGPIAPVVCVDEGDPGECVMLSSCALSEVWSRLKDAAQTVLLDTTVADIAKEPHVTELILIGGKERAHA